MSDLEATTENPPVLKAAETGAKSLSRDAWENLRRRPAFVLSAAAVILFALIALAPQLFAGWFGHGDPRACDLASSVKPPMSGHPFGFDVQGCDLYANVIYGARSSISIGLIVACMSFVLAVVLGGISGYLGRAIDMVVSRIADIFFGFPFILGAIVLLNSIDERNVVIVSLVLALFTWPSLARLMRSSVLAVRNADYVLSARALGASDWRIIRRHITPNAIGSVVVITSLTIGSVIAAESSLTFLGVGLQAPAISWGLQLSAAQSVVQTHPHMLIFPGAFLSITVLSFVVIGDLIRDAFDPRAQ